MLFTLLPFLSIVAIHYADKDLLSTFWEFSVEGEHYSLPFTFPSNAFIHPLSRRNVVIIMLSYRVHWTDCITGGTGGSSKLIPQSAMS